MTKLKIEIETYVYINKVYIFIKKRKKQNPSKYDFFTEYIDYKFHRTLLQFFFLRLVIYLPKTTKISQILIAK